MPAGHEGSLTMRSALRKHVPTLMVAVVTSAITAAITAGGPATAHVTDSFTHLKSHIDNLSMDNRVRYVQGPEETVTTGSLGLAEADCPSGWNVVGGGGFSSTTVGTTLDMYPSDGNAGFGLTGWAWEFRNNSGSNSNIRSFAICLNPKSTTDNFPTASGR
jgi:hypothetical protein